MAHELKLNTTSGVCFAIANGEPLPWWQGMSEGNLVLDANVVENPTMELMRQYSGMDGEMSLTPVTMLVNGQAVMVPGGKKVVVRVRNDGTTEVAGIVGGRDGREGGRSYTLYTEANLFQDAETLREAANGSWATAGLLYGGSVAFTSINLGTHELEFDKSSVKLYYTGSTSFDGTRNSSWVLSPTMTVCANTLRFSFADAKIRAKARHTKNHDTARTAVMGQIATAIGHFETWKEVAGKLSRTTVSRDQFAAVVKNLFGRDENGGTESTRSKNLQSEIVDLFGREVGNDGRESNTAWGAINALSEYVEHRSSVRQGIDPLSSAFARALPGGKVDQLVMEAENQLLRLAL